MRFFIALAVILFALALMAFKSDDRVVEQLGDHMSRELIDGTWYYKYEDSGVRCSWSDRIAPVCVEVSDGR